jgi:hypothetical protein
MQRYTDHYNSMGIDKEAIKGESSSNLNWLYGLRSYSTEGLKAGLVEQLPTKVSLLH